MRRRCGGFTLLEMVVAIGIFAIIAAISYAALNNFLDAREQLTARRADIQGLQSALVLLERDLRYAVNRPVRNQFGDPEPAFFGGDDTLGDNGELLRLTSAQPATGAGGMQQLRRVAWRLNNGELSRVTWRVLDRYLDSMEYERVLLEDVESIQIRYFSFNEDDEPATDDSWTDEARIPAGVEVVLGLQRRGTFRRVLQTAGVR